MPFPVLGSNSAVAGGYEIDNSLRFNSNDSAYLSRTPSSAGNRGIWTVSCWVKKANPTKRTVLFGTPGSDNNSTMQFIFHQDSGIRFGVNSFNVFTTTNTFLMRDPSAWYHLLLRIDTSQGSSDNRTKFYINGERFTDFDGNNLNNISNGFQYGWNNTIAHTIGAEPTPADYMDGHIAEFYNIDGQSLGPAEFGETNENGVWVPKKYSGTYGTNGFKLEFKNSGSLGTDTSGNGNNFTANNLTATDQTTDTPTNNFATLNSLDRHANNVLSEGNLQTVNTSTGGHDPIFTNMAFKNGKWYAEFKRADGNNWKAAIMSIEHDGGSLSADSTVGNSTSAVNKVGYGINISNGNKTHNTTNASYGSEIGSILMWAFDADNGKIWWGEDGTWFASGDPAAGSNEAFSSIDTDTFWTLAFHTYNGNNLIANFGNPPFSISSGNSDANGYGNFEFAVPSGFYSLCTKNLAEYG